MLSSPCFCLSPRTVYRKETKIKGQNTHTHAYTCYTYTCTFLLLILICSVKETTSAPICWSDTLRDVRATWVWWFIVSNKSFKPCRKILNNKPGLHIQSTLPVLQNVNWSTVWSRWSQCLMCHHLGQDHPYHKQTHLSIHDKASPWRVLAL